MDDKESPFSRNCKVTTRFRFVYYHIEKKFLSNDELGMTKAYHPQVSKQSPTIYFILFTNNNNFFLG